MFGLAQSSNTEGLTMHSSTASAQDGKWQKQNPAETGELKEVNVRLWLE